MSDALPPDLDDTGKLPILTDAIDESGAPDSRSLPSTVVTEVMTLADGLLHQAVRDIEATLFENVLDRLRAQLPEIVARALRARPSAAAAQPGEDELPGG